MKKYEKSSENRWTSPLSGCVRGRFEASEAENAHAFQAGPVGSVELWGKGAAVVTYESAESAAAAVKLDRRPGFPAVFPTFRGVFGARKLCEEQEKTRSTPCETPLVLHLSALKRAINHRDRSL